MKTNLISCCIRVAVMTSVLVVPSYASLIGQQVTGEIFFNGTTTNFFDPVSGLVPVGYLNAAGATVTIGDPEIEFGLASPSNRDIADFAAAQLTISDEVLTGASPWEMRFTSLTPGLFTGISLVSETFTPGLTYGLLNDTLVVSWSGSSSPATYSAVFDVATSPASVPEPSTVLLLGAGCLVVMMRRRKA